MQLGRKTGSYHESGLLDILSNGKLLFYLLMQLEHAFVPSGQLTSQRANNTGLIQH